MLTVLGEVSGFRGPNARSGHCYFQLKDDESAMDAIVWRGTYQKCGFRLKDGMKVLMTGHFNIYAASGRLSFVAKSVSLAGEGLLRQQVAALARKLEAEGLMSESRKRPIPRFCTRVCVVTSLSGSVIDDVKRTLARRNPLVVIQEAGCTVQGPGAPQSIIRALGVAAAAKPDAILLVRGGGSFEDLMTFNDESLARAVAACPCPWSRASATSRTRPSATWSADRRCSTPTAAAESVAPCARRGSRSARRCGRSRRSTCSAGAMPSSRPTPGMW
jgi:exodeoxyribonuclease VII large subunit